MITVLVSYPHIGSSAAVAEVISEFEHLGYGLPGIDLCNRVLVYYINETLNKDWALDFDNLLAPEVWDHRHWEVSASRN